LVKGLIPQIDKNSNNSKAIWKYYILVYEKGKTRPVETIPGMG
jgi:hypothetical protein